MTILYILIALVIGAALAWAITYFYLKNKHNQAMAKTMPADEYRQLKEREENLSTEKAKVEERSQMLSSDLEKVNVELSKQREEVKILSGNLSGKNAEYSALNEKMVQQKAEFENMRDKLGKEFENVANKIFEEKNKSFRDQSQASLDLILVPLKDKLKAFEERANQIHHEDTNARGSLLEKIKQLSELNTKVTEQAENLTSALKGKSKIQGDWGEMVLEEMLQAMGLEKDVHYIWQKKFKEEEDPRKSKQPDIIINLPDDRHIVVDSKVSLKAYSEYFNAKNEAHKIMLLKDHLESVTKHINELAEKDYHDIHDINTPDFVVMFMPIEGSLHSALQEAREKGRDLFKEAFDKKIILASTSTLFPIFKTISYIWNQDKQSRNAFEIAKRGGELYDKFANFVIDMQNIGKSMKAARNCYDGAFNKLFKGRGNLIRQVEMIKELGAKVSKELPQDIASAAKVLDSD